MGALLLASTKTKGENMKKILFISLMVLTTLYASERTQLNIKKKCVKAGAPIAMTYTAPHVDINTDTDVSIEFTSSEKSPLVELTVAADDGLDVLDGILGTQAIILQNGKTTEPLTYRVQSSIDGLYYIKIVAMMKGRGTRAFAIPVTIGKGTPKLKKSKTTNTPQGRIIIQKAVETIQ